MTAAPPAAVADNTPGTLVPPPAKHTMGFRRITEKQLLFLLPGTRLQDPAGIAVARLQHDDDPEDPGDDDEVTLVGVDRGAGKIFTNFGFLRMGSFDGEGSVGPLSEPSDVAIDRAGRVAITDTGNQRVVFVMHTGSELVGAVAWKGFREPRGVAADGRGGFYVCDRALNTVFHVDPTTGRRSTFGLEVAFEQPVGVATVPDGDRLAGGRHRAVVIVDRDGRRIRSFGPEGTLRASTDVEKLGVPESRFEAIDLDYYGNVFAVDPDLHRIHKFRDDLLPLDRFGSEGKNVGEFRSPRGIAINRKLGQVFVSESDGGQYLWIGTDVKDFRAEDRGSTVDFSFLLTEESTVTFRVLDADGREVATVIPDRRTPSGPHRGIWDGTTTGGGAAPAGDYFAEIRARATYASRSVFECRILRAFTLGVAPAGDE